MMESSNLDHHHHQQDLQYGSSSLPPLPFHEVESHHKSNQTLIFNNGDFIPSTNGAMVQDLGFQWANTAPSYMNQETMPQIKEEFLDSSNNNDLQAGGMPFFGGNFSLVLPNTNFNSDMNPLPSSFPFSMAMDLRSLDILASCKLARSFYHPSMNSVMFFNEDTLHELGHHQHQQQQQAHDQGLSNGHHHKMKTLAHGVPEEKRANTICQSTSTSQTTTKKHRPDLRSSFNHFKVRKEKVGDRIAALQQLVAPFGKTDTASVLMEAIGYIKFLQDQVETLSVPYMRSSGNKKLRTIPGEGKDEHNSTDLRSRGLCLMPLSCTSYVTDENGVGLWSSPNFTGGT